MEGDLARTIERNLDVIAHFQLADNPRARHEPGTGEINYPFLFDLIDSSRLRGLDRLRIHTRHDDRRGLGLDQRAYIAANPIAAQIREDGIMVATASTADTEGFIDHDQVLEQIQDRVLWLSMNMVHHANNVRPSPDGGKVGGHQASSASVATIMTSLYFDFMRAGDRISVKPHAAPVYHAIQYLLDNLDPSYLPMLRQYHGLQAYPSRTKDPDDVDFSTGSVGLGPVAPNFAALVDKYNKAAPVHTLQD